MATADSVLHHDFLISTAHSTPWSVAATKSNDTNNTDLDLKIKNCRNMVKRMQRKIGTTKSYDSYGRLGKPHSKGSTMEYRDDDSANSNDMTFAARKSDLKLLGEEGYTTASYGESTIRMIEAELNIDFFRDDPTDGYDAVGSNKDRATVIANPHACPPHKPGNSGRARTRVSPELFNNAVSGNDHKHLLINPVLRQEEDSQSDGSNTYDNSSDESDNDNHNGGDKTTLVGNWITRRPSTEWLACLCCIPGEGFDECGRD